MNRLAPYACILLCTLYSATGFSQTVAAKPKQFNNFPQTITCTETELSRAFNSGAGQNISLSFSDNFTFSGAVLNNLVKYSNLQTVVLKSSSFNNSIFSISKLTNSDASISYVGRIINRDYFDGYELTKNDHGVYQLVKIETDRVIQNCLQH